MSKIVTEEEITELINDNLIVPKNPPSGSTPKRCITKDRLNNFVYADEDYLTSYDNNQLVPFENVKLGFFVSLDEINAPQTGGTYPFYISSSNGYTTISSGGISVSPSTSNQGIVNCDITVPSNNTYYSKDIDIVIREKVTLKEKYINILQPGLPEPDPIPVTLWNSATEGSICSSSVSNTYYIRFDETFETATKLWLDVSETPAPNRYYTDKNGKWRQWNGSLFIDSGDCF